MSSTSINTLSSGTINGLTSLDLDSLTTSELSATNIDGNFFSIETIEANDIKCDGILELTESGVVVIGKNTAEEITITDTQVGYLDNISSNIQTQINNVNGNTSQLQIDLDELEDDVNQNQSRIGLILSVQDDLYSKTILQTASSTQQKTTFSGKLILSSLSNLDVGVSIQANTANIATNTANITNLSTQQTTNTADIENNLSKINTNTTNIENLSTQQTTNNTNIQNNTNSIGATSGGPINSLFDRVQGITASSTATNINSNNVYVNDVDVNAKFDTIDDDILGNSNAITSSNVAINNNLSKLTINTNNIDALQTKVAPTGSIMMYSASTAPTNWYICNGDLISKSLNIDLWSLLGNTFLNGRTPQTLSFYLPDMRQLFVVGSGDNSTYPVNATNKNIGDYNAQSIQQHAHAYERPTNSTQVGGSFSTNSVWDNNTQSRNTTGVVTTGGGQLPNNSETRPYCMAMNYIIKK